MRKILQFMKNNVIGFILGLVIAGSIGVYAVSTISDSSEVSFDNTGTTLVSTNVKDALIELYGKVSNNNAEIVFKRLTSSTTSVNCGFTPRIIIVARGMNSNYPEVDVIDYELQKAVCVYHNNSNKNGGMNYDDNGYGYTYIPNWYNLNSTGFTTNNVSIDGGTTYGAYVWCIK